MTKGDILNFIDTAENESDCREIIKAARARQEALATASYKARVVDYWKRAIYFREGQTLYCAAAGTFIGGPMQRGDKGTVYRMDIDGRKKTIWLKLGKRIIGFRESEALRYNLQPEKPEKSVSPEMRGMAERLAGVLP